MTGINESRTLYQRTLYQRTLKQSIYHANMNVSFIVKNGTQIKSGIMVSVSVSVKIQKNIVCAKKKTLYLESCFI